MLIVNFVSFWLDDSLVTVSFCFQAVLHLSTKQSHPIVFWQISQTLLWSSGKDLSHLTKGCTSSVINLSPGYL